MTNPPNTMLLAAGSHTQLAVELNATMAANWGLRHAYLVTWGVAWSPLPTPGAEQPDLTLSPVTVIAPPISNASVIAALKAVR